ncbi:hypothetical protein C3L23_06190 [Nautilia sp. PV-1]|uniref:hypothetical protein n=1 Tax=Nautilia sp. PV-1 TaxID=2579250 RepID=UPI000FD9599F|nr:hypothetical protein [Nautilia sp. PV-1]AZV46876.1 hypothetical protein C3L23_06190 [Nautilia sp. PV-1]
MEARLEIAGLDEAIKQIAIKAVRDAIKEVIEPVLKEFKAEMVATSKDELMKKPVWTKKEIMAYTSKKSSWVNQLSKKYPDFPKKLNPDDKNTAIWDRDELLKFFARHPEIPTIEGRKNAK